MTASIYTIGIAGGSGAGKTTFAHALSEKLGKDSVVSIPLDSYYHGLPESQDPAYYNYDHPDALDLMLLIEQLQELKRGKVISIPLYDYCSHQRTTATRLVAPSSFIIVEGVFVLSVPEVLKELDFRVFVHADEELRLYRRLVRDKAERGRTEESIRQQFITTVKPMHDSIIESAKFAADIIVDGAWRVEQEVEKAHFAILARIAPESPVSSL